MNLKNSFAILVTVITIFCFNPLAEAAKPPPKDPEPTMAPPNVNYIEIPELTDPDHPDGSTMAAFIVGDRMCEICDGSDDPHVVAYTREGQGWILPILDILNPGSYGRRQKVWVSISTFSNYVSGSVEFNVTTLGGTAVGWLDIGVVGAQGPQGEQGPTGTFDVGQSCAVGQAIQGFNPDNSPICVTISLVNSCGNGVLEAPEECDDNNNVDGDGCSSLCAFEMAAPCPCQPFLDAFGWASAPFVNDDCSSSELNQAYWAVETRDYGTSVGIITFQAGVQVIDTNQPNYFCYADRASDLGAPVFIDGLFFNEVQGCMGNFSMPTTQYNTCVAPFIP